MDEIEKLTNRRKRKESKLPFIHRLKKTHRNLKMNHKIAFYAFYAFIIIIFILLLNVIVFLLLENKRLSNHISSRENQGKDLLTNHMSDEKNKFTLAKKLFQYNNEELIEDNNLTKIHISYSLDNKIIYPTFVSMVSGLENNDYSKNIIVYHLLLSYDFNTTKIEIFESLKKNYKAIINYYIIPHMFSNTRSWSSGTDCVYYKIILPMIFPDFERIIYLDGDTLIRKDLSEMYNYPFNGNYILGFPFYMTYVMDKHGINATHYINGGCLLFNIKKIRKDHKDVDLLQFTYKNNSALKFREQDSINYIFHPNIGFLPLKYGIYMIGSNGLFKAISKFTRSPLNLTEGYEAVKDPGIVHFSCCWPKIWTNGTKNLFKDHKICMRYQKEFYYYANKTQYYSEIYKELYYRKKKEKKRK